MLVFHRMNDSTAKAESISEHEHPPTPSPDYSNRDPVESTSSQTVSTLHNSVNTGIISNVVPVSSSCLMMRFKFCLRPLTLARLDCRSKTNCPYSEHNPRLREIGLYKETGSALSSSYAITPSTSGVSSNKWQSTVVDFDACGSVTKTTKFQFDLVMLKLTPFAPASWFAGLHSSNSSLCPDCSMLCGTFAAQIRLVSWFLRELWSVGSTRKLCHRLARSATRSSRVKQAVGATSRSHCKTWTCLCSSRASKACVYPSWKSWFVTYTWQCTRL